MVTFIHKAILIARDTCKAGHFRKRSGCPSCATLFYLFAIHNISRSLMSAKLMQQGLIQCRGANEVHMALDQIPDASRTAVKACITGKAQRTRTGELSTDQRSNIQPSCCHWSARANASTHRLCQQHTIWHCRASIPGALPEIHNQACFEQ